MKIKLSSVLYDYDRRKLKTLTAVFKCFRAYGQGIQYPLPAKHTTYILIFQPVFQR
jgi:hypothetical protein